MRLEAHSLLSHNSPIFHKRMSLWRELARLKHPHHGSHIDSDSNFLKNYPSGVGFGPGPPGFMELLLNLAWLLLALPAYWLWHSGRSTRKCSSLQCLLVLGCVLVILFPVISATDDLIAMRTEMEESPASKRSLHSASCDKASIWNVRRPGPAVLAARVNLFACNIEGWRQLSNPGLSTPAAPAVESAGRAPPRSFPA